MQIRKSPQKTFCSLGQAIFSLVDEDIRILFRAPSIGQKNRRQWKCLETLEVCRSEGIPVGKKADFA